MIPDILERPHFPVKGFLCGHIGGNLKILIDTLFFRYKIDFCISVSAHCYSVSAAQQFEIDDIFKRKAEIVIFTG